MKLWLLLIVSSVLLLKTEAGVCEDEGAIDPIQSVEEETVTLTFGCSYDVLTVEWARITKLDSVNHLQYTCYDINGTEVITDGLDDDDSLQLPTYYYSVKANIAVNLPQTAVQCNLTGCYTHSDLWGLYFTPKSCDVIGAPPVITPLPNKTEVWAGSNFNLTCNVTGSPQPVVTWEKDGEPFDLGLYPNVTYLNGELVFYEANEEVSGNYSCVATNFLGNETSEPTNVAVLFEHPNITTHPLSKTVNESSTISLVCEAMGHPQPIISWEKDGQPFDPELYSNVYHLDEGEILILIGNATENFTGVYVCVATNSLGNATSDPATIEILRPSTSSAVFIPTKSTPIALASTPTTSPIPTSTPAGPPVPTSTSIIPSLQISIPTPTNTPALLLASTEGKDDTDIFIIVGLVVGIVLVLLLAVFVTLTLVTRTLMCMPSTNKFILLRRTKVPPFWADFIQPETIIDPNFAPVDIYPTVVVVSSSCESIFDSLLLDGRRLSKEDIKQLSTSEDLPQATNVVLKHLQDDSTMPKSPNESTVSAEKSNQEPPSTDDSGIQRESPCGLYPVIKASTSSTTSYYDHLENEVSDNPVDKDLNGKLLMDVQRFTDTHTSKGGYVYNDSGLNLELATVGALSEDTPIQLHHNNTLEGFNVTGSEHQSVSPASSIFPSTEDTEDDYMWIHSSNVLEQGFSNDDNRTQEIVHREGYLSRVPLECQTKAAPMQQDICSTCTVSDIPIAENCQIDSESRMTPVVHSQVPLYGLASDVGNQNVTYVRYNVAASSCSGYVSDASICTDYSQETVLPVRNVSSGYTNNSELDIMKEGYLTGAPLECQTKAVPMHQDSCPTCTVLDIPIAENCQVDRESRMTPVEHSQVPLFGLASDVEDQDVTYVRYNVAASNCSGYVSDTDYSLETVLPVCSVSSGYMDNSEQDFYNGTESDHHLSRYSSPSGYVLDDSSHPGMQQV